MFLWKYRKQFRQTFRKLCTRSPKKTSEAIIFSNKRFHQKCSSEILDSSFDNPAIKNFNRSPKNNHDMIKLIQQTFPRKKLFWKSRIQFWQSCQKKCHHKPEENLWTYTFFKTKTFPKCSSGTVEFSFDKAAKKFSHEARRKSWK